MLGAITTSGHPENDLSGQLVHQVCGSPDRLGFVCFCLSGLDKDPCEPFSYLEKVDTCMASIRQKSL